MKASEDLSWAEEIPAPRDADGKLVPLFVDTLYTNKGKCVDVGSLRYDSAIGCWTACYTDGFEICSLTKLHLTRPDSWERLEADASKTTCGYFGHSGDSCACCPATSFHDACNLAKAKDIVRRAKALAGVSDDD